MKRLIRPKPTPPKIEPLLYPIIQYPTYQDYLASSRWAELREQALIRDGRKCRVCNSCKFVQVHHRKYPKVWGEETVDDLTSMCDYCHHLFSMSKKKVKKEVPLAIPKSFKPLKNKVLIKKYDTDEWAFVLTRRKTWKGWQKRKWRHEAMDNLERVRNYLRSKVKDSKDRVNDLYGI
jgi:hypothetical protein